MHYARKIGLVADILSKSNDWQLRALAWELRDRLEQRPPLSKQEAERLLKRAERAVAVAAAWETTRRQRR